MHTVVFVPLAHNITGEVISDNAALRCRTCLHYAWERHKHSDVRVVLAAGAGAIPGRGSKTLAEYTEDFFVKAHADLPMIINKHQSKVYGTLQELQWVIASAYESYDNPTIVVVSQKRHIVRVRLMHRWFFPGVDMEYIVSDQTQEVPLIHEFLAYIKLVLVKARLGTAAEKVRRYTARYMSW